MLGAILVLIITHFISQPTKKIVTVNITGIVNQFIKDETHKNLPNETIEKEVKNFGNKLESTMKQYANQHNLVLLPSEAVIAGSTDYTDIFTKYLNEEDTLK